MEWICYCCGQLNDRDVNAAKNILRFGRETLAWGNPVLNDGEYVTEVVIGTGR